MWPISGWFLLALGAVAMSVAISGWRALRLSRRLRREAQQLLQAAQRPGGLPQFDPVTALLNGRSFSALAQARLAQAADAPYGLLRIDLDHFKRISAALGPVASEQALAEIGGRLRTLLAADDLLGRSAADEFWALIRLRQPNDAERVALRIAECLQAPLRVAETPVRVSASIGIALYPGDGGDLDTLFRHAGLAVSACKQAGRNRSQRYHAALTPADDELRLEQDLRRAIAEQTLEVHYQPVVAADGSGVRSLEALARWQHPEFGAIGPDRFVRIAEQHGFVDQLDFWVLRRASRDLQCLRQRGFPHLRMAVNCSPQNLSRHKLPLWVARALREAGLPLSALACEVTENAVMANVPLAVRNLEALRARGVKVCIDDFGCGHSSLAYLRQLPVAVLKVDAAFVREIPDQAEGNAIVAAIIAMAHQLKLRVVAEGVETAAQLDFLRAHACDDIQGYLYSRPLPFAALCDWLTAFVPEVDAVTVSEGA